MKDLWILVIVLSNGAILSSLFLLLSLENELNINSLNNIIMKFKRVTVTLFDGKLDEQVIGRINHPCIFKMDSPVITTFNENMSHECKNELWICDILGDRILMRFDDIKFNGMWADIMKFTGYLILREGKYKSGTKVNINLW
jgi:hypothetical protein